MTSHDNDDMPTWLSIALIVLIFTLVALASAYA